MSAAARWVICVLLAAPAVAGCTAARVPPPAAATGELRTDPARAPSSGPVPAPTPSIPPPELASFHVGCVPGDPCPEGIGMVVGPASESGPDGMPNRCTGTLVGPDRLLTASHCLPARGRRAGGSCRGIWVAFPSTEGRPMEWAACDRVLDARSVDDAGVLRPDWAVVRLATRVPRRRLAVLPDDPPPHAIVRVVAVDPHPIYGTQHALETRLCRVRTSDEARVMFGPGASEVGWLSDCPTLPGNSGAPVLDLEGRVRGIVHGGSHPVRGIGVTTRPPSI